MKTLSQIQQQQLRIGAAIRRAFVQMNCAKLKDVPSWMAKIEQLGDWASELAEQESLARGSKSPEAMRETREISLQGSNFHILNRIVAAHKARGTSV